MAFDVTAGGCSVSLWYLAQGCRVVIGDTNARLIGCLRNLQQDADNVVGILASLAAMFAAEPDRKAFFVSVRDRMNTEDPGDPYVAPGAFVSYGKGGFTLADRLRFGAWLRDLDRRGVRWTVTDTRSDHALSTFGLWSVDEVSVRRSVSATTKGRGKASEILVRNWQSPEARAA